MKFDNEYDEMDKESDTKNQWFFFYHAVGTKHAFKTIWSDSVSSDSLKGSTVTADLLYTRVRPGLVPLLASETRSLMALGPAST